MRREVTFLTRVINLDQEKEARPLYMIGMGRIHAVLRGSTRVSLSTALLLCTGKGDVQQPWPEKGMLTQGSDQVPSLRKSPRLAEAIAGGEGHLRWLMEEGTK